MTAVSRRPLVQKSAWSTAAAGATALGNFATSVVVARVLGPDGKGESDFLSWIAVTAAVVAGLGVPSCLQRYVADLHGRGRDADADALARGLLRLTLGVAAATAVLGAAAALAFAPPERRLEYVVLWVLFLLQCGGDGFRSYLVGMQQFRRATRTAVATTVVQVASTSLGAATFGVAGALAGAAVGLLVPALPAARLALGRGAPVDPELRRRVRRYAVHTYLAAIVSLVAWSRLEVAFLEPTWGSHGVAMFTTGLGLATLASQSPMLLAGALLPHMAERAAAGDMENVRRTYAAATRILGALVLPMCFGAAAVAPALVPAVFGERFRDAVPTATLLCAAGAVGAIASVGSSLVYAMERSRFVFLGGLVGAAMALVGYAVVIPVAGPFGAATTRTVVQCSMVALGTWYIARRLHVPVPIGSLVRSTAAAAVCAGVALACVLLLPSPLSLAVAVPAAAVVYAACARALRALEPADARLIQSAVDLLPAAVRGPFAAIVRFVAGSAA